MMAKIWFLRGLLFVFLFFAVDFVISEVLLVGLNKYFGLQSNSKILVNGSSMSLAGFNKVEIEKATHKSVAFYSRNGVSLEDRNAMLHQFFNSANQKTEMTILEVNPLLFSNRFTADNVYILFLPFMDDMSMNSFIKSKTSTKEYWIRKLIRTSRFNSDLISVAIKGYLGSYENNKNQVLDAKALEGLKNEINSVPVAFEKEKIELFKKTIALTAIHSKKIVLVNMPIFSIKMKTFRNDEYTLYLNFLKKFTVENGILFLDLNESKFIENPNNFSDPLHVNANGQKLVTAELIKFINSNKKK